MTSKAGAHTAPDTNAQTHTGLDRITVALIPRAAEALAHLTASTGLSKTDAVNRAITLYEFIDSQLQAGNELIVMDEKTGKSQTIRLF